MEEELITIIVPIFNIEKYLDKCVQSIIQQTYKNLEIILVDDGSTDNCHEMCDRYAKEDNRIVVIHQKNQGLSEARNTGIRIAKGKYIGFVDSDDYIAVDMYEKLYKKMLDNNADISICRFEKVMEDGNIYRGEKLIEKVGDKVYQYPKSVYKLLEDRFITNHAWNKLYKKELFNEVYFPIGKKYEDIGTIYKLFCRSKVISYTEDTTYYYLQRSGSILNNKTEDLLTARIDMIKERYEFLKNKIDDISLLELDRINNICFYHIDATRNELRNFYFSNIMQSEREILKSIIEKNKIIDVKIKRKILIKIILMNPKVSYKLIKLIKGK